MKKSIIPSLALAGAALSAPAAFGQISIDAVDAVVESSEKPKIHKMESKSRIVIRTKDGDNVEELVFDSNGAPDKGIWKNVEDQLTKQNLDEKTMEAVRQALKKTDSVLDDHFKSSAIVVDDDGERHVVELRSKGHPDWIQSFHTGEAQIQHVWPHIAKSLKHLEISEDTIERARVLAESYANPNKKHMIGVKCRPLDGLLRSQLLIDEGIVVDQVFEGTPAKGAGIQQHDILLQADDRPLTRVEDLVDAVQTAGIEDRELTLSVLRQGEKVVVALKTEIQKHQAPESIFNHAFPKPATPPSNPFSHPPVPQWNHGQLFSPPQVPPIDDLEDTIKALQGTIKDLKSEVEELSIEKDS